MFWPNEGKIDTIIADPRDVRTEPRDSVPGSEAGGHLLRQSEGRDREGQSAADCLCCNACCKQIRCRDEFIMSEKRIAWRFSLLLLTTLIFSILYTAKIEEVLQADFSKPDPQLDLQKIVHRISGEKSVRLLFL